MKQWGWEILKYSTAALFGMLFLQPFADLIRNFLREKPDVGDVPAGGRTLSI
jgi:hypothetical protein